MQIVSLLLQEKKTVGSPDSKMELLELLEKNLAWTAALFGSFVADRRARERGLPTSGPEWAFVHTPLNREGKRLSVPCESGLPSPLATARHRVCGYYLKEVNGKRE